MRMLTDEHSPLAPFQTPDSAARPVPAMMKAIAQPGYGTPDILKLKAVPVPVPADNEVLIRVHAAAICRAELHLLSGKPYPVRLAFGLFKPKHQRIGQNVAGVVAAAGRDVTAFRTGDAVFGEVGPGSCAEYVTGTENRIAPKPASLSFEEAASLPISALAALHGLHDKGSVQPRDDVLINGASGGIGTLAVQMAKAFGANVTAVSAGRHEAKLRGLGADEVIDYTTADFAKGIERYDVILDLVGNRSLREIRRVMRRRGRYIAVSAPMGNWIGPVIGPLKVLLYGLFTGRAMMPLLSTPNRADLTAIGDMAEAGTLRPVIDSVFPFAQTADACRHLAKGHASGTVVIKVA